MNVFDKQNSIRLQNFIRALTEEGLQILVMYNSRCREETFRVFVYTRHDAPMDRAVYKHTVEGVDITELIQTHFANFNSSMIASLKLQIERMKQHRYFFSNDYSYETLEVR
jgi:hypothetical protein